MCSHIECNKPGLYSLSEEYGIFYSGYDTPLLFCDCHFTELFSIYSTYKDIETSIPFRLNIHTYVYYLSPYTVGELTLMSDNLKYCIKLRTTLSKSLNSNVISDGHSYFLESLKIITDGIDTHIYDRYHPWTLVVNKKRRYLGWIYSKKN